MNKIKLHLGCGNVRIDGFINIDVNYLPNVDVVDNVRHLRKFKENSVTPFMQVMYWNTWVAGNTSLHSKDGMSYLKKVEF